MAPTESGGVFITTQKIYDKITETSDEVSGMRADLKAAVSLLTEVHEDVKDHETRIRGLERLKYALPVTGLVALGGIISQIFHIPGK